MNLLRTLVLLAGSTALLSAAGPVIYYNKSFPGSTPAWVSISVDKTGRGDYKEAPEEEAAPFHLTPAETDEIFALAGKLDRFARPLEAPVKVANMGMKTFRFEDGATKHEVKFNYSMDADARTLADWFERITESRQHFYNLERSVRFDKLSVNKYLLLLQASFDRKRIVAPEQYLPLLDRVAKNESYLHMARERAAALADVIRVNGKPKAE